MYKHSFLQCKLLVVRYTRPIVFCKLVLVILPVPILLLEPGSILSLLERRFSKLLPNLHDLRCDCKPLQAYLLLILMFLMVSSFLLFYNFGRMVSAFCIPILYACSHNSNVLGISAAIQPVIS